MKNNKEKQKKMPLHVAKIIMRNKARKHTKAAKWIREMVEKDKRKKKGGLI